MRLLIVKTTSMGDVVHALPVVSDALRHTPGLEVDWLVESPFAAIPALHPGVQRVLPLGWRKWRKRLGERATWQALGALRRELREQPYDLILDLQGLLKSALWGLQAHGPRGGYDWQSAREPMASLLYTRTARVPRDLQAVERCRRLAAAHLGYPIPTSSPDFGIQAPKVDWAAPPRHAVLIPCASRAEKLWPQSHWIAVGQRLVREGLRPVVLWGSEPERMLAERVAQGCGGVVPPFLTVKDSAGVLGSARCVVGLDTGFSHLGAAFGRPTLGIYCDHEPGLAGITGPGWVCSIGGKGAVPSLADVMALVERQLQAQAADQRSSSLTGG